MVGEGEETGAIGQDEKELIENIFEFDDRTAEDVMVHRTDMEMIQLDDSDEEIVSTIRESGLSRFPVYGEDVDDIVGILSTRQYLLNAREPKPLPLEELLRPAFFVPESVKADVLFRDMQRQKVHMAIVVDEYGGTSGLVTMEDLLEQLVGEIYDEFDREEEQEITPLGGDRWRIAGSAALEDVAEECNSTMEAWTLGGVMENASLSAEGGGTQGRVTVMGENGTTLHPLQLLCGRNFFPEELKDGAHVIILDEQAALALFRISDPIDRKVTVQGVEYRVIGVARHRKQVGDLTDYGAYIPLMSVIDQDITLDALQVEAAPRIGVGASVSFSTVCGTWQQGGTVIDLGKEGMAATLWLRVLLCLAGATALLRLIGWLNGQVRSYAKQYRQQLQVRYALSLMPQLAGMILLFCLGYGGAAALAAVLMNVIIQPVYTFPEWIPAVLVEWEDIAAAFWKVWQTSATLREMRSPEILRLRYFTLLIQGCSAATGVLLALWYARRRTALQGVAESLPEMRRQGVVVSVIRTARPIAFGELGYVPCAESEVWQREPDGAVRRRRGRKTTPMLRIIHVQRLLEQLPASPKDGSFVLEVTDAQIPANNARWEITCEQGVKTV